MLTLYHIRKKSYEEHDELPRLSKNTWLDVENPTAAQLRRLAKRLDVTYRELHHAIDDEEHPRVSSIGEYAQIVFRVPYITEDDTITTSCAFLINKERLISIHEKPYNLLHDVAGSLADGDGAVKTPGELLCHVLSEVMRKYFKISDVLEEHLDDLEEMIFNDPANDAIVQEIFTMKKTIIYLYKSLTANREVIMALERGYGQDLKKSELNQMRYIYHDVVQLIDMIETLREIVTSTLEIHVSGISNRLNISMKRLTVYGSIVLIPTLIASIYGMNFRFMPELHWRYGYLFSLALMAASAIGVYCYFRWKEWI